MKIFYKLLIVIGLLIILTACFIGCGYTEKMYTVAFNTNGGNYIETQNVRENRVAVKPTDPVREGYTFIGWYKDSLLTKEYDFRSIVNENLYLYAKWEQDVYVEITFQSATTTVDGFSFRNNSGGNTLPSVVKKGSTVNFTVEKSGSSHGRINVYKNDVLLETSLTNIPNLYSCSFVVNEKTNIRAEIVISVVFETTDIENNTTTVTKDININETLKENTVQENTVIVGQYFDGWYYDNASGARVLCGNYKISDMVRGNTLNVYGSYKYKNYTLKFETNGGSSTGEALDDRDIEYNDAITLTNLTKEDYTFIGWFTEDNGEGTQVKDGPFILDYSNNDTITLYAYFVKSQYNIAYEEADGFSFATKPSTQNFDKDKYDNNEDQTFKFSVTTNQGTKIKFYYTVGNEDTENTIESSNQNPNETNEFTVSLPRISTETINIKFRIYYKVAFATDGGYNQANPSLSYGDIYILKDTILKSGESGWNFANNEDRTISALTGTMAKTDYIFNDWFKDAQKTQALEDSDTITSPMILYAGFVYGYHTINLPTKESGVRYDAKFANGYYSISGSDKISLQSSINLTFKLFKNKVGKAIIKLFKGDESTELHTVTRACADSDESISFTYSQLENTATTYRIEITIYNKIWLSLNGGDISTDKYSTAPADVDDQGNRVIKVSSSCYTYLKDNEQLNEQTKTALNSITKQYYSFKNWKNGESVLDLNTFKTSSDVTLTANFTQLQHRVSYPNDSDYFTITDKSNGYLSDSNLTFKINLTDKLIYSLTYTIKIGSVQKVSEELLSDNALTSGSIQYFNITFAHDRNEDQNYTIDITAKVKISLNLSGGDFKDGQKSDSISGTSTSGYYMLLNAGSSISDSDLNPSKIEITLAGSSDEKANGYAWYLDSEFGTTVNLSDIGDPTTFDKNTTIYAKYNMYEVVLPTQESDNKLNNDYSLDLASTQTQFNNATTSYEFKIKLLKDNISKVEIYVNNGSSPVFTETDLSKLINGSNHSHTLTFNNSPAIYTFTVKIYYPLFLDVNGGSKGGGFNDSGIRESNGKYYISLEKGIDIAESLVGKLSNNANNGNSIFTKANSTFSGWFTENTYANQVTFDNFNITQQTTIYLKWTTTVNFTITAGTGITIKKSGTSQDSVTLSFGLEDTVTPDKINQTLSANGYNLDYSAFKKFKHFEFNGNAITDEGIGAEEIAEGTNSITIVAQDSSFYISVNKNDDIDCSMVVTDSALNTQSEPYSYGSLVKLQMSVNGSLSELINCSITKSISGSKTMTKQPAGGNYDYIITLNTTAASNNIQDCGTRRDDGDYDIVINLDIKSVNLTIKDIENESIILQEKSVYEGTQISTATQGFNFIPDNLSGYELSQIYYTKSGNTYTKVQGTDTLNIDTTLYCLIGYDNGIEVVGEIVGGAGGEIIKNKVNSEHTTKYYLQKGYVNSEGNYVDITSLTSGFFSDDTLNNSGFTELMLDSHITSVAGGALLKLTGLTKVTLPNIMDSDTAKVLGWLFNSSATDNTDVPTSLTQVTINNGTIAESCFAGTSIAELTLNNITEIGSGAFGNMENLQSLSIPFVGKTADSSGTEGVLGFMFGNPEAVTNVDKFNEIAQIYNSNEDSYTSKIPKSLTDLTVTNAKKLSFGALHKVTSLKNITVYLTQGSAPIVDTYAFMEIGNSLEKIIVIGSSSITYNGNAIDSENAGKLYTTSYTVSGNGTLPGGVKNLYSISAEGGSYEIISGTIKGYYNGKTYFASGDICSIKLIGDTNSVENGRWKKGTTLLNDGSEIEHNNQTISEDVTFTYEAQNES